MIFNIDNKTLTVDESKLSADELSVLLLICTGTVTQRGIAKMLPRLGCHKVHEIDVVPVKRQHDSTLRMIREIIRTLRIVHHCPILSDAKGYWIAKDGDAEIALRRMEKVAESQAKSWFRTFKELEVTFDVKSDYFSKQGQFF